MNCIRCGFKNPGTVLFCQSCGGKLDLTADEISIALAEKKQDEKKEATEYWAEHALFFAAVFFVLAMTLFILSGGTPEGTRFLPSISRGASWVKIDWFWNPVDSENPPQKLERLRIPLD